MHCFHPPSQSNNRIGFEAIDGTGQYGFLDWWRGWVPASASIVDVSHNLLRQPRVVGSNPMSVLTESVLLGGESVKWPELQRVDASHNSLWGSIMGEPPGEHYNFDVSNNNISGIQIGSGGTFSASAYMRQMFVVDWRNQTTPVKFMDRTMRSLEGAFSTIDDALNLIVDGRIADYLPRLNSFEQVEYPKGSKETPFACPLW
jgi:hypothetical protein